MKVQNYNIPQERTDAQFRAMYLKQKGYQVTKFVTNNDEIVAFGYNSTDTLSIKPLLEENFDNVKEEDYYFIYWN